MSSNTCLSNPKTYDVSNMRFANAVKTELKEEGGPSIKFSRIPISTMNPDGSVGELVLETTELFSFGVSENKDKATKATTGYTLPLCLWNKEGPSEAEKALSDLILRIVEKCKDHLVVPEIKKSIGKASLVRESLIDLGNVLYFKKNDDGEILPGVGPVLYPKLIESKKAGKILTPFADTEGNDIDPKSLIGTMCFARTAIKIESLYIGSKISLQIKLYDAEIRLLESGVKRLLRRPVADSQVHDETTRQGSVPANDTTNTNDDENEDEDTIKDDENEDEGEETAKPPTPPPATTPARKAPRRVAAKK
jgi:hypothetical protein